jgi:tetratricopeptide (TPR) repeat protein
MWQKYYGIAERQMLSGKMKTVEMHALKALQYAEDAKDPKQVAATLSLLSRCYLEIDRPRAEDTLRKSVAASEAAFGADSIQLGMELKLLAVFLQEEGRVEEAEPILVRGFDVLSASQLPPDVLCDELDDLVASFITSKKFDEAEKYFLRALEIRKETLGAASLNVGLEIEKYQEILRGLGREKEADDLSKWLPYTNNAEDSREDSYSAEVAEILEKYQEVEADLDSAINVDRERLLHLTQLSQRDGAKIDESDKFVEWKRMKINAPVRMVQTSLAQLLRVKAYSDETLSPEEKKVLLSEAATLLKQSISESLDTSDERYLMFVMFDLALLDPAFDEEFESLLGGLPDQTAALYAEALYKFVRNGATGDVRRAMRDAIEENQYVAAAIADPTAEVGVPEISYQRIRAHEYAIEMGAQWLDIPGAIEFMVEELTRYRTPSKRG